jgi:hypothetical protein
MIRINSSHLCLLNRKSKKEFILLAYASSKYLFCLLRGIRCRLNLCYNSYKVKNTINTMNYAIIGWMHSVSL